MDKDPQTNQLVKDRAFSNRKVWGIAFAIILLGGLAIVVQSIIWSSPGSNSTESSGNRIEESDYTDVARLPTKFGPSWSETDDPTSDGWNTEAFQRRAKKQLKRIGKLLLASDEIDGSKFVDLIDRDFSCGRLRPKKLATVYQSEAITVQRAADLKAIPGGQGDSDKVAEFDFRGADGLVETLKSAAEPFSGGAGGWFEFKVFRVEPLSDSEILTRQFLSINQKTGEKIIEQHANWIVRWVTNGEKPLIRSIQVESFEQSVSTEGSTLFSDCTASVLGSQASYDQQFLLGLDHWFEQIQDQRYSAFIGISGVAIGDVNNDGLEDMYVCQETGLPNRLFLQNQDGSLMDVSQQWGVNWLENSRSALFLDLDNDGDQDLVVAILGGIVIAENMGNHFSLRDVLATSGDTTSICAADYDNDGRVDVYVCVNFSDTSLGNALPSDSADFIMHDANDGGSNSLFRNSISDGRWQWEDVTKQVGLDVNNRRYSWAASWEDFDNDGDMDLYVANDWGRDNLYRNDFSDGQSRFEDVSETANVENAASGMSTTFGDYDRDGLMDVHVSNMYSSAGNRIAFQNQFQPTATQQARDRLARLARGNTLLRNRGDGAFDNNSAPAGIEMGRWAWGSLFVDINNDGWQDLFVSNGFVTTEDTGDL